MPLLLKTYACPHMQDRDRIIANAHDGRGLEFIYEIPGERTKSMTESTSKQDVTLYASDDHYASGVQIIRMEEELIVSFSAQPLKALRESPLHPHAQPVAKKHYAISRDSGSTWTYTDQPPGLSGLVHATRRRVVLQDGKLLSVRHEVIPGTTTLLPLAVVIHKDRLGGEGKLEVQLTDFGPFDSCHDWEVRRLEDGSLLLAGYAPCLEERPSKPIEGADFDGPWPEGVERYSALFLHGSGDGRKWKYLSYIRNDHVFGLAEPSIIAFPGGRIVTMIRAEWSRAFGDKLPEDVNGNGLKREGTGYYFYQSESSDGGNSWSQPAKLDIWGHPAHLLELQSGNVVMVYGHRRPPFSVRAILSRDQCRTWDLDTMRTLHTWEPGNYDLGYPVATQLPDGRIFCCFHGYSTDDVGEKMPHGIFASCFDERWLMKG